VKAAALGRGSLGAAAPALTSERSSHIVTAFLGRFTQYGPAVVAALVGAAVLTLLLWRAWSRQAGMHVRLFRLLLADALLVIALLTLMRASAGGKAVNLVPGAGLGGAGLISFCANAALFVPAGIFASLSSRRRLLAFAALGLALPVVVESLQYYLSLNRISDINDVIANALGALLGFALVSWPPSARRLSPVGIGTAGSKRDAFRSSRSQRAERLRVRAHQRVEQRRE